MECFIRRVLLSISCELCPIEITSLSELLNDFRPKLPPEVFVILCLALEWSYKHIEAINYFSP